MMVVSPWNAGTGRIPGNTVENVKEPAAHYAQKTPCVTRTTRRDPVAASLERRRQDRPRSAGAARRVRVAPARPRVHGPRAERPHPAGDSARQRGVLRFTDARQVRCSSRADRDSRTREKALGTSGEERARKRSRPPRPAAATPSQRVRRGREAASRKRPRLPVVPWPSSTAGGG